MMLKAKDMSIKWTVNADNAEVRELRRQVQQLQKQLAVMSVSNIQQSTTIIEPQHKSLSVSSRFTPTRHKDDYFCYRCGEDGHIATKCQAPSNADQVIQKLVRSLRRAKSGKPEETRDCKKDSDRVCFTKRSQPEVYGSGGLPKRLVGPASTVEVELNGCLCQALLDSGSQVAIVFENWYSNNLSDEWGLSSFSYPYKGYIVVDVTFPASVTGVEESLCILAMVCPEPKVPHGFLS